MINTKFNEVKNGIITEVTLLLFKNITVKGRRRTAVISARASYESCSYDPEFSDDGTENAIMDALHSAQKDPYQNEWTGNSIDDLGSYYRAILRAEYDLEDIDANSSLIFSATVFQNQ